MRVSGKFLGATVAVVAVTAVSCSSPQPNYAAIPSDSGTLVAASGFDVQRDGFSFRNWGPPTDRHGRGLTPAAMQSLFGDRVCTSTSLPTGCVLTATGQITSEVFESAMSGGHCFGMAALAGLAYRGDVDKEAFLPAGATVYDADPSPAIDGLVGRYFNTQMFDPTESALVTGPFGDIVDNLEDAWSRDEDYLLAFYQDSSKQVGHAVTPIAVRDLGDGRTGIVLYDNNFPGEETMLVGNPDDDSWFYSTSADPKDDSYLFVGDAENEIELFPLSSMTAVHDCPTCDETDGSGEEYVVLVSDGAPDSDPAVNEDPEWTLEATDTTGTATESIRRSEFINNDNTALLQAPRTTPVRLTMSDVEGTEGPADINVSVLGDGWVARIQSLRLEPGVTVTLDANPVERTVTLTADGATPVDLTVGTESGTESRSASIRAVMLPADKAVTFGTTDTALTLTDDTGTQLREVELR